MAKRYTSSKVSKNGKKTVARKKDEGLRVLDLGLVEYSQAWEMQKELVDQRAANKAPDSLILLEHPTVVTCGRKVKLPPDLEIPVFEIERGGDLTLHAPGQLVGYPILYLSAENRDLHEYMRRLEEVLIRSLADFGLEADRRSGFTGVWIGSRKIASIGVACRKWVSYHGFALNVSTDLSLFQQIRPCGLDPTVMTSLEEELGSPTSMRAVKESLIGRFSEEFSATPTLALG